MPAEARAQYRVFGNRESLAAAKAVLVKHIPQLVEKADVAERASGMTLKEMQDALRAYSPDLLSDAVLQKIDVDLATLPAAS